MALARERSFEMSLTAGLALDRCEIRGGFPAPLCCSNTGRLILLGQRCCFSTIKQSDNTECMTNSSVVISKLLRVYSHEPNVSLQCIHSAKRIVWRQLVSMFKL